MFLIDDLLLAPFRGIVWVARTLDNAAHEEMAGEADAITEHLRQLYLMLESGQLSELEFDDQERCLLDRLDAIKARDAADGEDGEDGEDGDGADGDE